MLSAPKNLVNPELEIVTYNIHKGFSPLNRHLMVHELRAQLRTLDADIVFLQEVQGLHRRHAQKISAWPSGSQHDFLADGIWQAAVYEKNSVYKQGHHGNAILSRFPIAHSFNQDVTQFHFERRGLLHCQIEVPGLALPLHCVCVHLSLFAGSRRKQMAALAAYLEADALRDAPLVIAGDFNDWRNDADALLAQRLNLTEVFAGANLSLGFGVPVRSFPAKRPIFRLDRIYVRGFSVKKTQVHAGVPWSTLSDHAALSAQLCKI